ncbi:hypothetical protein BJ165DRAFT_181750 [Panaeolus papilionaceus]|nr:hypothetical protein BJ165DRAFT_181750 [Panaeolus papilionaceus]
MSAPIVIPITPTEVVSHRSPSRRRASPISFISHVSRHSPARHRSRSRTPLKRHRSRRSPSSIHYSPIRSHPIVIAMPPPRRKSSSPPRSYRSSRSRFILCRHSRSPRSRRSCRTRSRTPSPRPPTVIIQQPPVVISPPLTNAFPTLGSNRVSITDSYASMKNSKEWLYNAPSYNRKTGYGDTMETKSPSISAIKREESKEPFISQTWPYLLAFIIDTIPRQIYLHVLLRLPYLYFTRVSRIFEEAEMSIPEIKQGILETAQKQKDLVPRMATAWAFEPPVVSEPYQNLNKTWIAFIDSLLKEWKTLNIISVLLLTAILTILQLDGAGTDPLTRFTALISMICALMSLLFGCMYIIRFGTMRKTYKAAEWASEAKRTRTGIFWNVWVMLAMPAAWLAWSMVSYIVCVMSFVWRTGTLSDTNRDPFSDEAALIPRIIVTVVLSLGLIYFSLIALTLRRYGALMDRAWQRRIQGWIFELEAPLYQKSNIPSPSKLPTNTFGMSTLYPEEKIAAYKADEKLYPAFQSEPVYPALHPSCVLIPPPSPSVSVPKRELKSAMGPGSKNCGIHWDSKAKVGSSVVSIYPESEIKPTSGVGSVVEPPYSAFTTLFTGSTNLYASVRPPTPPPRKETKARSTSSGANHQDDDDDDSGSFVCRRPAGMSNRGTLPTPPSQTGSGFEGVTVICRYSPSPPSPFILESNSKQELSCSTMCYTHILDRDKTAAKLAEEPQEKKPLIRMTRLVGLSDGDPPLSIPPTEYDLEQCGLKIDQWKELHMDAHKNWKLNLESEAMNQDHAIHAFIAQWNKTYSAWSEHQIRLCEERTGASPNGSFAIYHFKSSQELPYDDTQYDVSGLDIQRVDVLGPFGKVRDDDVELRRLSLFATHLYIGDELLRENVLEVSDTKGGEKPEIEVTSPVLVAEESSESDDSDD